MKANSVICYRGGGTEGIEESEKRVCHSAFAHSGVGSCLDASLDMVFSQV